MLIIGCGQAHTIQRAGLPVTLAPHRQLHWHCTRTSSSCRAKAAKGAGGEQQEPALSAEEQRRVESIAAALSARLGELAAEVEGADPRVVAALLDAELPAGGPMVQAGVPPLRPPSRRGRGSSDGAAVSADGLPEGMLPKVAIIGRPNVGKSALFNRIVGQQVAIVYDSPGVTRDRLYTRASWGSREFMLVDTGGLMSAAAKLPQDQQGFAMWAISAAGLPMAIERQAAAAAAEADVLVLVVDGQSGGTAADEEILAWLRRMHPDKPLVLAVNKCENTARADLQAAEFWSMGLDPLPVSAISGSGTGELMERLVASLPLPRTLDALTEAGRDNATVAVAIVGRPNVGKSSLLNALVGEERSIVSSVAGTTRDAIDTQLQMPDGRAFNLVDTAGVRKRTALASSRDGAEGLAVERAFRAVRRSEVAVLVLDAIEGITQQDFRLAEYIAAEGRACVVAVNKWDAVPERSNVALAEFEAGVRAQLRPVEWANVVFISARTGQRVKRVLDAVTAAAEEHHRRISTSTLNLVLSDATAWRQPPTDGRGRRGRIYYGTQASARPPTFVLFCNDPLLFPEDYRKFIERQLRDNVGFPGSPLRLFWRGKRGDSVLST